MEKFDRSTRRHHRRRVFVKRIRQFFYECYNYTQVTTVKQGSHEHWTIVRHLDTPSMCRNICCVNPRRLHRNGAAGMHPKQWRAQHFERCDARYE